MSEPLPVDVAKHYLNEGKVFSYLDVAADFGLDNKRASRMIGRMIDSKSIEIEEVRRVPKRNYQIRMMRIVSVGRKEKARDTDKANSALMRAFGIRYAFD